MIRSTRQDGVTVIELGPSYESLDDDALEEIGGLLLTEATVADPPRVVIDLSGTDYFGSTFIELLVRAWKRLTQRRGTMVLCGVQPLCAEVLQVSRLDTLWPICRTQAEAVIAAAEATVDG